jgi:hypothetical protein
VLETSFNWVFVGHGHFSGNMNEMLWKIERESSNNKKGTQGGGSGEENTKQQPFKLFIHSIAFFLPPFSLLSTNGIFGGAKGRGFFSNLPGVWTRLRCEHGIIGNRMHFLSFARAT